MKTFSIIFINIIWFIFNVYGQAYISEINFIDNEYVEIYSDDFLNLSMFKLYDESGINKSNILNEIKIVNDSKYFLVVSDNFISNNNISNLNCSIFTNKKPELGYYGLKNSAENLTIFSNSSNITLDFQKIIDLNFNENESLNFNMKNNSYFISNQSPCIILIQESILTIANTSDNENFSEIIPLHLEITNLTNNNLSKINESVEILNSSNCNYSFEILTTQEIFTDKLKYKFKTNATNFTIEYWIEDFGSNIIKNGLNSTTLSEKSFTPKFSEILVIKSKLYAENNSCILNSSKIVYFYSPKKEITDLNVKDTKSTQIKFEQSPYIKILNQKEIENLSTNILEYEIYRGNSSKKISYIYHNGKKLVSFELEKYSKIDGKINFDNIAGNNSLVISGFDIESKVIFYPSEVISLQNNSIFSINSVKEWFEIVNFSLDNNQKASFNINSSFDYNSICQIYYDKTVVSNVIDTINASSNDALNEKISLDLDISKIHAKFEKIENNFQNNTFELKLSCKYKKSELKTYKYYFYYFNYSLNDNLTEIFLKENRTELSLSSLSNKTQQYLNYTQDKKLYNYDILSYFEKDELKTNQMKVIQKSTNENKNTLNDANYISTNYFMKENSYFGVFLASTILLISLISIW